MVMNLMVWDGDDNDLVENNIERICRGWEVAFKMCENFKGEGSCMLMIHGWVVENLRWRLCASFGNNLDPHSSSKGWPTVTTFLEFRPFTYVYTAFRIHFTFN